MSYRQIARQMEVPIATLHAGLKEYARTRSENALANDGQGRGKCGGDSDTDSVRQRGLSRAPARLG